MGLGLGLGFDGIVTAAGARMIGTEGVEGVEGVAGMDGAVGGAAKTPSHSTPGQGRGWGWG